VVQQAMAEMAGYLFLGLTAGKRPPRRFKGVPDRLPSERRQACSCGDNTRRRRTKESDTSRPSPNGRSQANAFLARGPSGIACGSSARATP